jgi:nucleotide-binding universal stress UspA family protein
MDYVSPLDESRREVHSLAARRPSLASLTVVLLDINKRRGDEFLDRIEARLQQHGARTVREVKKIFSRPAEPELIRRIANRGDLTVEGLAD